MSHQRWFGPGGTGLVSDGSPGERALPRTALPVVAGVPKHLEAHLHRLEAGALALGQPVAWLQDLSGELRDWLLAATLMETAALRLVLDPQAGLLAAQLGPLPVAPRPCRLLLMPHPLGARQADPRVTHKGLAGSWGKELLALAQSRGADDALLQWPDGTLAETTLAAVALEVRGVLLVPPPLGRVASLAERLELPEWARTRGLRIRTTVLTPEAAGRGRLWCLNALRGIWPATLL